MGVILHKTAWVNEWECEFRVDFNFKSTPSSTLPCQCHANSVSMGESAQLAPSSSFYVVTSAILGCKTFKI